MRKSILFFEESSALKMALINQEKALADVRQEKEN